MNNKKKMPLATQIFIALILGIAAGWTMVGAPNIAVNYIKPFGTIFLNLIKFIVVPIVLFSIMSGVISMKDIKKVGAIGWKTLVYFTCTTAFAIIIGLAFSALFKRTFVMLETSSLSYQPPASVNFMDTLIDIFPNNFISPMLNASMLQVIVMALFLSFGIIIAGEKGKFAVNFIESFNEVFMNVMDFIIKLSPIGVFCLITPVVAENGPKILSSLFMVILTAYIAYVVHAVVVYSLSVQTLGGISPLKFFKGSISAIMLGFSSASSVGAIPLNLECAEKLGAKRDIASFVIPLGTTVNMDGTAIYQGVCTIFIAACYGINLTLSQIITVVLTATLASIGTAGVPGAGMIMLAMVLQSVGLPVEGIALVAGIDRIFDMGRTAVNVAGNTACAVIISNIESKKEAKKAF